MRTSELLLACCLVAVLPGCGSPPLDEPVDPGKAAEVLNTALESWKTGEAYQSLAAKEPPVVFSEPLWEGGTRLLNYELGAVERQGRQGRCTVKLVLRDKSGKQYERRIGYQIDTVPRVVIVREALGP